MEEKRHKCYKCKHFNRYYIKEVKRFSKIKFGWCCKACGSVDAYGCCEKFVCNSRRKIIPELVQTSLNDLLTEISVIRNIIEEELNNEEL